MADPVSCLLAINNVRTSVQGNDKGGKYFKACIVGKIESTKQHIENPQGYADELYNEIKNKCS